MHTLITNGACFDMRHVNSNTTIYTNKNTGQCYHVTVIADTWHSNGASYTDVMVLVNGAIRVLWLDERITNRARRYTMKYLFSSETQVVPVAKDAGERYVKRQEAAA